MPSKLTIGAVLLGVAAGVPTGGLHSYHLPPLIPAIPGVTVPLGDVVPALPIVQAPTPAMPSPDHPVKNIRPKKFAHIWTGAGDRKHKDFLASYSLDDDTFGQLFAVTDVPSSGNEPHHMGPSHDGKVLWGGGLLSLLKTQDTGYYFDVSDNYHPKFLKSDRATLASIADDVVAKPDGGFFFTYMGSAAGTAVGRLIETDADYNIIHEWPEDQEGLLNILERQFTPHGLNVNFEHGHILTSDFVVPASVLKPSLGVQGGNTLRLWELNSRKIVNTINIPRGDGIQDIKFIPKNPEAAALASVVGLGEVWIIYPERKDADGKPGLAKKFFDLGPLASNTTAIFSDMTSDGKYAYFTYTTGNHIAQIDISDLDNPKRLDDYRVEQPIIGPHFLKVTPDQKHLLVCDYFLQTGSIGIVNTPSDYRVQYADIQPDGSLKFDRYISFANDFPERGGGRPHSFAIYDYSGKYPTWL